MSKQLLRVGNSSPVPHINRSNAFWVGLFFFTAVVWGVMIYFTLVPWLMGTTLPVSSTIDISILTWAFVILSLVSSALWFVMQAGFLIVGNRMTLYQKKLISQVTYTASRPLVSIVIPARNEEVVIRRTISSALTQSYTNIEVLVICHNCTDNTFLVASKFADKRVRALDLRTEQAGKGIALDYAAENSLGKYLLVLIQTGS